ncbi:hypothetical protein J4E85_007606 [Alternaria conjuncta]|uniref:uncharacterized protein n=1 Tax=Alternaria conjuncta TaxID=181017 RepID=UPI00222035BA|nr:uncharacterized protein J4E85_007606 [Alternaria conjuncta]KAI4924491.1 hypothetical protein J4E85_007606 [Alternaria conjuncta]
MKDSEPFESTLIGTVSQAVKQEAGVAFVQLQSGALKKIVIISVSLTAVHGRDEFAEPPIGLWLMIWHFVHCFANGVFTTSWDVASMPPLIADTSCVVNNLHIIALVLVIARRWQVMARPKIAYLETVLHLQSQILDVPTQFHVFEKSTR